MASVVPVPKTGWSLRELFAKRFSGQDKDEEGTSLGTRDEEWCLVDGTDMETVFTGDQAGQSQHPPRRKSGGMSMRALLGTQLGGRSGKGPGDRSPRPGSPSGSPLQRKSSGRSSRHLEVENGGRNVPPPRSISPGRNATRLKKGQHSSPSVLKPDTHTSAGVAPEPSVTVQPPDDAGEPGSEGASFAKVRDTLKIRRAKKRNKLKPANYSALQYSAPEINLQHPSKYQDPFEASFSESAEGTGQGHEFKTVSIPHNKPEYCDHCGDNAWGFRQVLKCTKCDFIVHRKCEQKVNIDCMAKLEQAVLQHDKQVEEADAEPDDGDLKQELDQEAPVPVASDTPTPTAPPTDHRTPSQPQPSLSSSPSSSPSLGVDYMSGGSGHPNSQVVSERVKLSRKIREYNRKTTPVHHIHIKTSLHLREEPLFYQGFVRVHMCAQRPIHVSTAITRTSWYRVMRPVKERGNGGVEGFETAFYLPTDTNRLVHISNTTTTKELIQILLKKFCVTDNPKKFSLYEEYGSDSRRLFDDDCPLQIVLEASAAHRNSKLVLRDNTYSTIQWDAFSPPELSNFIQILHREEELHAGRIKERFQLWKKCVSQVIKEKTMEEVAKQTKTNVSRRVPSSAAGKPAHRSQVKSAKVATPPRKSSRTTDAVHTRV